MATMYGEAGRDFSLLLISLLKGVLYMDDDQALWQKLLNSQAAVRDYVRIIGLELVIHEEEGFAWLKSMADDDDLEELPRLTPRRQLSYPVSLLLALLRRRLAEHDAASGESRLILGREEIIDLIRTFLPAGTNEARLTDQIDAHLNKIIELGFVRRLKSENNKFEVRRILKAFIDAQWLYDFDQKLQEYIRQAGDSGEAGSGKTEEERA